MKSNSKALLALVLVLVMILSVAALAGCNNNTSGTVTITVENGMGGGEYEIGEEVTVRATVPLGKTFVNWTVDGTEVSKENPYTFKAEKDITITANFKGGQSLGIGDSGQLDGDWADAVYDENLEVTINWWRMQPLYFVGDTLMVSEYPVESFTDERANDVDDYETILGIAKEGGAEEVVSNAEGYTFTEAGKYTLYRYALKDGKFAKSKGFELTVIAPNGTASEGVALHNAAVVGTEYALKRSTVNGSMGNILEGTADFSYVAFKKEGGYGPNTYVSVIFTGKNRPNIGMFFNADHTLLGGKTGFIVGDFATYSEVGSQTYLRRLTVFDYASIGTTGDIISNPIRPATFSGGLDGVNDLPCAWNLLDDSKTYEYVVGSWAEPIKGTEKNKLVLSVELYEIGGDGTKTLVYSQNRDISNNGQYDYAAQTGDIVLFGSNKKEIQFSASIFTKEAPQPGENGNNGDNGDNGNNGNDGDNGNTGGGNTGDNGGNDNAGGTVTAINGGEIYNGSVAGNSFILKQSTVRGSLGNILGGTANFSYLAFMKEGGYGAGTWVSMTFTGKNRPNVGMFFDANHTLLGGTTGFILGDFAAPNGSQTYLRRLTVFDYANINSTGDLIANPLRPANFTGASGVNDLPCAWNSLDDNKTYEYIVGTWAETVKGTEKSKLMMIVQLYEIGNGGTKTLVYTQERDITNNGQYAYATQRGDIVLLGSNMKDIKFSARILTEDEVNDIRFPSYTVTVTNGTINGKTSDTVRSGQKATVIANAPAAGKWFVKWVDGAGKEVSTSATYEFTVTGDISLTAVYADIETYTITVVGGTVDGTTSKVIESGESVTVVADTPAAGKKFVCWKIGEDTVSFETSYTFTPEASLTITAVFEDLPAEGSVVTNLATENPDGTYTVSKSPLGSAYKNDIYNEAANLDWGYVAIKGSYSAGTWASVTFTGQNRPTIGFGHEATNTFNATTGFVVGGSYDSTAKGRFQLCNMEAIHLTGSLSPNGRVLYSGENLPAFNFFAADKTYELAVGTWIEDGTGTSKYMVGVVLFEIAEDGTRTCIYQQSRDIHSDGVAALSTIVGEVDYTNDTGDIVFYGAYDADITFSASVITDSAETTKYRNARKGDVWGLEAGSITTNKAQENPDGTYTVEKSGLTAGNRDNIYGEGANLDWGYVAFKGDYGAGTMISVTFTGKNRPSFGFGHDATNTFNATTGFILGGSTSGGYNGTKGRLQIFNMNSIHTSGKLISTLNRIAFTGTPLDPAVTAETSTDSIAPAFDYLDSNKTYEFVVGTWLEDLDAEAGTKKFMVNVILFEIAEDGTKTCIYQQSRDANDNGRWEYEKTLGDVVLYGAFDAEITFAARLVEDPEEITKYNNTRKDQVWGPEAGTIVTNKAQENPDGTYTIQKSGLTAGNRDNIYGEGANLDWGYVAFKGDYGAGTMVSVTFTGKNRPSFGFGHDATNTFNATTGFILGGSTSGGYNGTKGRFQIFNMNSIHTSGKLISTLNRIAYTGTPLDPAVTAATSTDSIAPAFDYLDPNKKYEMVIGTWLEDLDAGAGTKKFMVNVILFEIAEDGTKTCIYQQSRDANDNGKWEYEKTLGDVVLYGAFDAEITFAARLVEDSEEITKYNNIRKDQVWEP